jgi:hypothetical protein
MAQASVVPALPDLSTLLPADLDGLLAVFENGERGEEFASFILLRALSNWPGDFPAIVLEPQQRRRFLDAVQRKSIAFVRKERDSSEWLASVVTVQWCAHAPDAAFATLEDVDITRLGPQLQETVISLMSYAARSRIGVRTALDALSRRTPALAGVVQEAMEQAGVVSEERLLQWSRRWIEQRDPEALQLLYHRYIENNGESLRATDIHRLLGDSPPEGFHDITFDAADVHVYLEFDALGRLTGWHAS